MAFAQRHIDVAFQLGEGSFGDQPASGQNTSTIKGLRCSAVISKPGGQALPTMEMQIFGMTLKTMNAMSTLGTIIANARKNVVTVSAYSGDEVPSKVFSGTINNAWVDMQAAPEGAFYVSAVGAWIHAMAPVVPSSFPTSVDVATVLEGLAGQMGLTFENNSKPPVSVQLDRPYYPGTAIAQAQSAARAAQINMVIDDGVMAIWPYGGNRQGVVPLISKDGPVQMVGYPAHTQFGIAVTTLYDPSIVIGGQVQTKSILTPANGIWTVYNVQHVLESETPDGKWFSNIECIQNGQPLPTPGT